MDELVRGIVDVELEDDDKPKPPKSLDQLDKELLEKEKDGLCDEAHLDVFITWYAFGGAQGGLTPMEAAAMPAAMRKDFLYILGRLSEERKARKKTKPKK